LATKLAGSNTQAAHPTWVLHDGPPFAHGKSHIGNMYNKVLKDILNRYKLLRGYRIHYVPGFDCHGAAVEDFYSADSEQAAKIDSLDLSFSDMKKDFATRKMSEEEEKIMRKRKSAEKGVKDSMML
jgi:isoleucyl-tRNA synthetase